MSRHQQDPLRPLTAEERQELTRRAARSAPPPRTSSAPGRSWRLRMARATRLPPTRSDDGTPRRSPPGSAASTATGSPPCGPAMGADHGSAMALMRSRAVLHGSGQWAH